MCVFAQHVRQMDSVRRCAFGAFNFTLLSLTMLIGRPLQLSHRTYRGVVLDDLIAVLTTFLLSTMVLLL